MQPAPANDPGMLTPAAHIVCQPTRVGVAPPAVPFPTYGLTEADKGVPGSKTLPQASAAGRSVCISYAPATATTTTAAAASSTRGGSAAAAEGTQASAVVRLCVSLLRANECRTPAEGCPEHDAELRVEVTNRGGAPEAAVVRSYRLPTAAAAASGEEDGELVVEVPLPRGPLANDASLSVTYTTVRGKGAGSGVRVGRAAFLLRDLVRGDGGVPTALRSFPPVKESIFPLGTQVCCEDVVHGEEEVPRAVVVAAVLEWPDAVRPPSAGAHDPRPPPYHLDVREDAAAIAALTREVEASSVDARVRLGCEPDCPSTPSCFWRAISDGVILPGWIFNWVRPRAGVRSRRRLREVFARLAHAALLWRECHEHTLLRFLEGTDGSGNRPAPPSVCDHALLASLRAVGGVGVPVERLLDCEAARIAATATSPGDGTPAWEAQDDALAALAVKAVQATMMANTYVLDAQVVLRTARAAVYTPTDDYFSAGSGHTGDCEDLQHPLMELFEAVAELGASWEEDDGDGGEDGGNGGEGKGEGEGDGEGRGEGEDPYAAVTNHRLLRGAAEAASHSCALTTIGMAWAAQPGAVEDTNSEKVLQGHMFCVVLPRTLVGAPPRKGWQRKERRTGWRRRPRTTPPQHFLLEGTTPVDVEYRHDPLPGTLPAFVNALGTDKIVALDLDTTCATKYQPAHVRPSPVRNHHHHHQQQQHHHSPDGGAGSNEHGGRTYPPPSPSTGEFYCTAAAFSGPALMEISRDVDDGELPLPPGMRSAGKARAFDATPTRPTGANGTPTGGVPLRLLLDARAFAEAGGAVQVTGWVDEATLACFVSLARSLPVPPPAALAAAGPAVATRGPPLRALALGTEGAAGVACILEGINGSAKLRARLGRPGTPTTQVLRFPEARVTQEFARALVAALEARACRLGAHAYAVRAYEDEVAVVVAVRVD